MFEYILRNTLRFMYNSTAFLKLGAVSPPEQTNLFSVLNLNTVYLNCKIRSSYIFYYNYKYIYNLICNCTIYSRAR